MRMYSLRSPRPMTGSERLDLRSSLPDMELGECVARSEGGEMLLDPFETLWLEAGQQSPETSPDRTQLSTRLGPRCRERKTDLVLHRPTVVGLTETHTPVRRCEGTLRARRLRGWHPAPAKAY